MCDEDPQRRQGAKSFFYCWKILVGWSWFLKFIFIIIMSLNYTPISVIFTFIITWMCFFVIFLMDSTMGFITICSPPFGIISFTFSQPPNTQI